MVEAHADRLRSITHSADRDYNAADFVNELRSMNVRPHVAQNLTKRFGRSALGGQTTQHAGWPASQRIRKRIEDALAGSRPSPDWSGLHPGPAAEAYGVDALS